jgi:hypothetical protein
MAGGQGAPVDLKNFNFIGVRNRLQGRSVSPLLAAGLALAFAPGLGSADGGLLLFLLLRPKRLARIVTRSNRTSRLDLSAGDRSFSSAINDLTRSIVASTSILLTVIVAIRPLRWPIVTQVFRAEILSRESLVGRYFYRNVPGHDGDKILKHKPGREAHNEFLLMPWQDVGVFSFCRKTVSRTFFTVVLNSYIHCLNRLFYLDVFIF